MGATSDPIPKGKHIEEPKYAASLLAPSDPRSTKTTAAHCSGDMAADAALLPTLLTHDRIIAICRHHHRIVEQHHAPALKETEERTACQVFSGQFHSRTAHVPCSMQQGIMISISLSPGKDAQAETGMVGDRRT